jgi:hypothetical protein
MTILIKEKLTKPQAHQLLLPFDSIERKSELKRQPFLNKGKKRDAANRLVQTALSTHCEKNTLQHPYQTQQNRKIFPECCYTAGLERRRETHKLRRKDGVLPKGYNMKDLRVTKR